MKDMEFTDFGLNISTNLKEAECEAWLTDGYLFEDSDSKAFTVLSFSDAKEKVKSLISQGKYDAASKLSERLLKPIEYTSAERSKSIRIPFPVYVKLIREAFDEGITLKDVIRKRVVSHLEKAITALSARDDINKEKFSLLKREFTTWKTKPEKDLSPSDYYSPEFYDYRIFDRAPADALVQVLIESVIAEHSKDIPRQTLEKILGEAEVAKEFENLCSVKMRKAAVIRRDNISALSADFNFSSSIVIKREFLEDYFELDHTTMSKVESLFEQEGDELVYYPDIIVLSVTLAVIDHRVFVEGLPVADDEEKLVEQVLNRVTTHLDEERIKNQTLEALNDNDMAKVAELTKRLEKSQMERSAKRFALKTILDLAKSSQVVSFRAPDVVIRVWEAYGNANLESYS